MHDAQTVSPAAAPIRNSGENGCLAVSRSPLSAVAVLCLVASGPAPGAADLHVEIRSPDTAQPGETIEIGLVAGNSGNRTASGTRTAGSDGYMIDVFVTDTEMPSGFARYFEQYQAPTLLRGGRISNTTDLGAGGKWPYSERAPLPADMSAGTYRLCARVDPGRKIVDGNRANNTACNTIRVGTEAAVAVQPHADNCLGAKRRILADGTIEMRYSNGLVRRLHPDGTVEEDWPPGLQEFPVIPIQTPAAELPQPPGGIAEWGRELDNRLFRTIKNLLTRKELSEYLQMEEDLEFYDKVELRLKAIELLTRPEEPAS